MVNFIKSIFHQFRSPLKVCTVVFLLGVLILPSKSFGQAANIDQIRNGSGTGTPPDTCGICWVNGNAGASNAHYAEGMSIAYRVLLTGLTAGKDYSLVMGYDTKHSSAMAIDYLTHYQRLEPHGPLGHPAEVLKPKIFVSGSTTYQMDVISAYDSLTMAFPVPDPDPAGYYDNSTNGAHGGVDDGTPVDNQPKNSFIAINNSALEPHDNVMTFYNATPVIINYVAQPSLVGAGTDVETQIRIRFTARKDSVLLAWGGHIASRLDWGYTDPPANTKPRSAGGISGSPYHMRLKTLFVYNGTLVGSKACNKDSCEVSLGNQDRSLSAAAVVPPPTCPTTSSQTKCVGSSSFTFTLSNTQAGATYTWSFGSNGINAAFQGGTNTGTTVTIVPASGNSFTGTGSFTLDIAASLNGVPQTCPGVATGTIEKTVVTASANPTSIDITSAAHSTNLTASITGSSDSDPTHYTYSWSAIDAAAGSLTNGSTNSATYTAALGDAGATIRFRVVATATTGAQCSDEDTVTVTLNSVGSCDVSAQGPVCQGSTTTHTGSPNPKPTNATYVWSIGGYGGSGTTTSTLVGGNSGTVTQQVNASQSYRITLTETYANTSLNTSCFEDVTVVPTPSVSTIYDPPPCDKDTFGVDVVSPILGYTYSIDQPGNNIDFSSQTKTPTAGSPKVHFTNLTNGDGYIVTVTTNQASCTATDQCGNNGAITKSSVKSESVTKTPDIYKIALGVPTKVNGVPNPFTDRIRFSLTSAISGTATLELYNILGEKIGTVYQGYVQAGKEVIKDYIVPVGSRGSVIYVFKVGDQRVTGKLIGLK